MKTLISFLFFISIVTPQQQVEEKWPKVEKDSFIKSCMQGAQMSLNYQDAQMYCSCMLDKVIKKYPTPEESTKMSIEEVQIMATGCLN